MSRENAERFLESVASDRSIEAELETAAETGSDIAVAAVELGRGRGLDFTSEEFARAVDDTRSHWGEILGDDDLAGVSGGINPQPEPPKELLSRASSPPSWLSQRWAWSWSRRK